MTQIRESEADFVGHLEARGQLYQTTSPDLGEVMQAGVMTGYVGFDPTADSLHVGSLVPVMGLARLQRAGHKPIALVGGGTGLIGDPSGKEGERGMLTVEDVAANVVGLTRQLERFLDFDGPAAARVVDNLEWLQEVSLIEFLRDIGKHFTVNQMMVRDSVRPRLEDPDRSISFTEFTYMLLQAYDFLVLFDRYDCQLQLGGSDQWGNIVSGCDLIRRKRQGTAHGITMPLITRADGKKFGKSEAGNVWLDPERTSPYQFYQFWLNTDDADVGGYLRCFTFLSSDDLAALDEQVASAPQERQAQRALAESVTTMVHGADATARAQRATAVLFQGGDWRELTAQELSEAFAGSPRSDLNPGDLGGEAAGLVAILADSGLSPSRGQARKAIESGAIYINNERANDPQKVLDRGDLLGGRFVVLRRGKKSYHVLDTGE